MEATTSDRNGDFPCPAGCGRFFLNQAGAAGHAKSCAWIKGCGRAFQTTSEVDSFRTALKSAGRYDEAMDLAHAWLSTWQAAQGRQKATVEVRRLRPCLVFGQAGQVRRVPAHELGLYRRLNLVPRSDA
tara:strand:+ start:491 stop:877 length:387 start_codon:yes stop_codon:yes gene_type:complete